MYHSVILIVIKFNFFVTQKIYSKQVNKNNMYLHNHGIPEEQDKVIYYHNIFTILFYNFWLM